MKRSGLKTFLKARWVSLLAIAGLVGVYFCKKSDDDFLIAGGLMMFFIIEDYVKYRKKQKYLAELRENGLTEAEADENNFIKKWETATEKGFVAYLIYNGLSLTIQFTLIIGFLVFLIKGYTNLFSVGPINSEQWFIISFVPGIVLGVAASVSLWSTNQKKFRRFTDIQG